MNIFRKLTFLTTIILAFSIYSPIANAGSLSGQEIKTITLRVLKRSNGWVRILSTGATIALTINDAQALGLSPTDSVGTVLKVVAIDTKNDLVGLGSDLKVLGEYVAVDVAMPLISGGWEYTGNTIVPKVSEWSATSYNYTKDTIIPKTGELLKDGYSGAKSLWKWATD